MQTESRSKSICIHCTSTYFRLGLWAEWVPNFHCFMGLCLHGTFLGRVPRKMCVLKHTQGHSGWSFKTFHVTGAKGRFIKSRLKIFLAELLCSRVAKLFCGIIAIPVVFVMAAGASHSQESTKKQWNTTRAANFCHKLSRYPCFHNRFNEIHFSPV